MLLGDFFVNMWYNKNDYEDQRMTIRIHDDVENNYYEETFYVTVVSTDSVLSEKELTVNKKASADIKSGDAEAYFTFTPKNTAQYNFMIEMQKDVGGAVYI